MPTLGGPSLHGFIREFSESKGLAPQTVENYFKYRPALRGYKKPFQKWWDIMVGVRPRRPRVGTLTCSPKRLAEGVIKLAQVSLPEA